MCDSDNAAPTAESNSEVGLAAEALKRAKVEFDQAQAYYETVRKQAAERVKAVRETSVGDIVDGALGAVRRHPGAGLTVAAILGFFLGRLFRR
jgi:ElaB/YqjD/DUF883 family membrane-anchored ribosome-binding protein